MKEKEYKDFSVSAKKGADKFAKLSVKGMLQYSEKYEQKTGKRASSIDNKEHFFSWVLRNKIR